MIDNGWPGTEKMARVLNLVELQFHLVYTQYKDLFNNDKVNLNFVQAYQN